jgi:hypothetical protein
MHLIFSSLTRKGAQCWILVYAPKHDFHVE